MITLDKLASEREKQVEDGLDFGFEDDDVDALFDFDGDHEDGEDSFL